MERISYSPETLFHVLTHFETADEALRAGKNPMLNHVVLDFDIFHLYASLSYLQH